MNQRTVHIVKRGDLIRLAGTTSDQEVVVTGDGTWGVLPYYTPEELEAALARRRQPVSADEDNKMQPIRADEDNKMHGWPYRKRREP